MTTYSAGLGSSSSRSSSGSGSGIGSGSGRGRRRGWVVVVVVAVLVHLVLEFGVLGNRCFSGAFSGTSYRGCRKLCKYTVCCPFTCFWSLVS